MTARVTLDCTLRLIGENVRVPVAIALHTHEGSPSMGLGIEFELPDRPMWFSSWFDVAQVRDFAAALGQVRASHATGASLWDDDRKLHLYLQVVSEEPELVGLSGFSYDYHLAEASGSPIGNPGEELPDLLRGEMLGLMVAFQGLVLPRSGLAELASVIRRLLDGDGDA